MIAGTSQAVIAIIEKIPLKNEIKLSRSLLTWQPTLGLIAKKMFTIV
jgi:hypothetical protein